MARRFGAEEVHFSPTRHLGTEDVYIVDTPGFGVTEVYGAIARRFGAKEVYAVDSPRLGATRVFVSGGVSPEEDVPTETLTLQPNETAAIDTFIQEAAPANAATTTATVAVNGAAGSRRNTLLKFDLSSLAGKTLTRARLYLTNTTTSVANQSFPVNAVLAANSAWVEGCTWQYAVPSTVRWAGDVGANAGTDAGCSVAGTDYDATPIGTMEYIADTPTNTEHEIELNLAQMQAMIAANYGFVVRRDTSGIFSLHSSSAVTEAHRPKLVVEYVA